MLDLIYTLIWVAGITFAPFVFIEGIISEELKNRLSDFLKSNPNALDSLPLIAANLFERTFGKSHFSLRCLFASVVASLLFLTLAYALRLLLAVAIYAPAGNFGAHDYILQELAYPFASEVRVGFAISVLANLILDYFALLKTRLIINFLARTKFSVATSLPLVVADIIISFLMFQIFYVGFYFVGMLRTFTSGQFLLPAADPYSLAPMLEFLIILRLATYSGYPSGTALQFILHSHVISVVLSQMLLPVFLTSVFFYASIAPSIWLWLFVLAGIVTRLIAPTWPSALYVLNFDRAPLKMIGLVASALVVLFFTFAMLLLTAGLAAMSALLG